MQKSFLITVSALIIAVLLVLFLILPIRARVSVIQTETKKLSTTHIAMCADIEKVAAQRIKTETITSNHVALLASGALEPLLGSFAMRGKSLLDPIAEQTGFIIESVKELSPIPLRIPTPSPEQLYCRQPVEFTGHGSFAKITAFIMLIETNLPLTTLSSILILGQPKTPERHKTIITFEWPAKGGKNENLPTKIPSKK